MKLILIGAGNRGMTYAAWAHSHGMEIAALAEPRSDRREAAAQALGVAPERCYDRGEALLALEKMADAAIIASMVPTVAASIIGSAQGVSMKIMDAT